MTQQLASFQDQVNSRLDRLEKDYEKLEQNKNFQTFGKKSENPFEEKEDLQRLIESAKKEAVEAVQ